MESIRRFIRDETGVTAAEYGIILGCIAAAVITAIALFYTNLGNFFSGWGAWFGNQNRTDLMPITGDRTSRSSRNTLAGQPAN